jgi:hypothetical protein
VLNHLLHGTPTPGRVLIERYDKTNTTILQALDIINPLHSTVKVPAVKWANLLIGQDRSTYRTTNIFGRAYDPGDLEKIEPPMNEEQRSFITRTLTALPNDLGIVQGGASTGKTRVDIVTALLVVKQGKKVPFVGPTNLSVDDYALKIKAMFQQCGLGGSKIIRYHTRDIGV